jgi:hypothetical protein
MRGTISVNEVVPPVIGPDAHPIARTPVGMFLYAYCANRAVIRSAR